MGTASEEEQVQDSHGQEEKIFVSVRLRPLNEKEIAKHDVSDWECISDTTIIYRNHLSISERSMYPSAYTFDRVFSPENSTRKVYEEGAKEVALSVVSGVNASVFAYGQTSSGKTYTMTGITDYTLADIYDYVERHKEREYTLKFSAMEIYNESVRDLLSADSSPLRLLDDPEKGTVIEKLTEETLRDWRHFKDLLSICEAQRQIGETALNEVSSRSHQILRLTIESSARELSANEKFSALTATVNFVDLAGSERASQSLSAGTRLKEGCHINRSLLTLGTVIRKLSKGKTGHIPFRDSKLTRILQSSLGGNARTAIICTMSPARIHVEQSRNTLLFASCAKEVMTNAQVNVVMSDKALVKHLQKELARLETELRSPARAIIASDSAAFLREKDLEIEKLKKEVTELTVQLDLARSEIGDLRRMLGDEKLSTESDPMGLDPQYPKLRVRSSWDSGNQTPESPMSAGAFCQDNGVGSCNSSVHSMEQSPTSSNENLFQLPDLKVKFTNTDSPEDVSVEIPSFVENDFCEDEIEDQPRVFQEEIGERLDENSEDICKEVRCIEVEQSSINLYADSNISESSPNGYGELSTPMSEANNSGPTKVQGGDDVKEFVDTSFPTRADSNRTLPYCLSSSPERSFEQLPDTDSTCTGKNTTGPDFAAPPPSRIPVHCVISSSGETLCSLPEKESPFFRRIITHPDFISSSPDKPFPWFFQRYTSAHTSLRLTRSKSCGSTFMSGSLMPMFVEEDKNQTTPPTWFEKIFSDRPQSVRESITQLKYGSENKKLSTDDLQDFACDASSLETESLNIKASNDVQNIDLGSVEGIKEITKPQNDEQIIHRTVEERDKRSMLSAKNVRDVALDPIHDYIAASPTWPIEFRRLQREIIELWHVCNVSIAHRTYFFLLFKGDQTDSIYLEVEHRRLSFIKESFSRGSKTVEDGRTLTLASSLRALNQERYRLSQQMKKKLSEAERENLFLRWGIGLNTKQRRLQLAHQLWSDTKDMEHIKESASVVAKVLGFVDHPDRGSKEMFGLKFALRRKSKKSSRWKRSVLSLSIL